MTRVQLGEITVKESSISSRRPGDRRKGWDQMLIRFIGSLKIFHEDWDDSKEEGTASGDRNHGFWSWPLTNSMVYLFVPQFTCS
ncbi:Splicing Factor 3B Subunit 1 [Manis pentadactyla]|nr:Splicing Factor 3B Subunit 1 [Manis pentadactyla]